MRSESMPARRPGRPALSRTAATEALERVWGIVGDLKHLPSDSDQNFRVDVEGDPAFVLKIANSAQSASFLEAVTALLGQLETRDLGTQRVITSTAGNRITPVEDDGTPYLAWVTEWIAGRTLADHSVRDRTTLRSLGEFLARLDLATENFEHPALHRDLPWDLANGARVIEECLQSGAASEVLAPEERHLFDRSFKDHVERYEPLLQLLPRAAVHNDPNDHNVLISSDDSPRVLGILDFGDAVHSFRVADLAIGSAYALLGSATPLLVIRDIVAGYTGQRSLSDLEVHLLLPLVRLRLLVSVAMSACASRMEPDNAYLTVSQEGAWIALRQLASMDFDQAELEITGGLAGLEAPPPRSLSPSLADRSRLLAPSLSTSYDEPLTIVRGWKQYLFDIEGRAYLDCVNNIGHVGHSHPQVVAAIARQAALLNTNSRYLHPGRLEYARRLLATFPPELDTCFFVSSGTEANELAWRIARAATGRGGAVVLDSAYHGNASATIALSPYKFDGPGGSGRPQHVQVAPVPDVFRGECRDLAVATDVYVEGVRQALSRAEGQGGAAALFLEPIPSCGGQIVPPDGFVRGAFQSARDAGAVAIADEVQTGFGRVGSAFWAFELDGARPDIVTLGKPMGNGHPLGAVILTRELAEAFANGMEYFASFGGNPVSCAAGLAVLEVIENEHLQQNAATVGAYLLERLTGLAASDERIGDVRGRGLFVGIEFVQPGPERQPDAGLAHDVVQRARGDAVLLSTDGPDHNVIKIKPPLVFAEADVDRMIGVLSSALDNPANA